MRWIKKKPKRIVKYRRTWRKLKICLNYLTMNTSYTFTHTVYLMRWNLIITDTKMQKKCNCGCETKVGQVSFSKICFLISELNVKLLTLSMLSTNVSASSKLSPMVWLMLPRFLLIWSLDTKTHAAPALKCRRKIYIFTTNQLKETLTSWDKKKIKFLCVVKSSYLAEPSSKRPLEFN